MNIPDLTDVVSPDTRKTAYKIYALLSAILFVVNVTVVQLDVVPVWVNVATAVVNALGILFGFVAKDNTPNEIGE